MELGKAYCQQVLVQNGKEKTAVAMVGKSFYLFKHVSWYLGLLFFRYLYVYRFVVCQPPK